MKAYINSMPYGFMVYWDGEKDAARYYVHLVIGDKGKAVDSKSEIDEVYQEIRLVEVDRNTKYYSFINLPMINTERGQGNCIFSTGKNYYVFIEAEDKNGNIISRTDKISAIVEVFANINGSLLIKGYGKQ